MNESTSYSILLAGGGIAGGQVYGASDRTTAAPRDNPVAPEDVHATFHHALGLPADLTLTDPFGRPVTLCTGKPILPLFG